MMKRLSLHIMTLCLTAAPSFARQTFETTLQTTDAAAQLERGDTLVIPMADGGQSALLWTERNSSLTLSEGIRTFVARDGSGLLGTLSVTGQRISGWVTYNGHTWRIDTSENSSITLSHENDHECGSQCVEKADNMRLAAPSLLNENDEDIVYNDAILYIYRLALPIDWPIFSSSMFNNDVAQVKEYWANTEVALNEIYGKYIGVYFTIVNDDRLIRDSADKQMYATTVGDEIVDISTGKINSIIGADNYDLSYSVAKVTSGELGIAFRGGAYNISRKGGSAGTYALHTVAHELGHMLGAQHTFTHGGVSTIATEPGLGQSLMSYGQRAGNYFSLPSINQIRYNLTQRVPYYNYPDRTEIFNADKGSTYSNIVCGIPTDNRPPIIDASKLKSKYRIPKNTYFRFHVEATDPDGDELLYAAHQSDNNGAMFVTSEPSTEPVIAFQPRWSRTLYTSDSGVEWKFVMDDYTNPTATGTFHFWLGASDGRAPDSGNPALNPHPMCYDVFPTEVEIADGTPFSFKGYASRDYTTGQRLTLNWNVDPNFFDENSRVRILMSDDFGQTWKYVLKESAPNNGSCEVIMPQQPFNYISIDNSRKEIRAGVIKVEEIGGIAYAVTATDPVYDQPDGSQTYSGGFRLNASPIVFSGTPERYITVTETTIPPVADVTARSGNTPLEVKFSQTRDGNVISRVWEAQNQSGARSAFEQIICISGSNPSTGINTVEANGAASHTNIDIDGRTITVGNVGGLPVEIFDLQGRRLFARASNPAHTIRLTLPSPGIYIVRVATRPARRIAIP